MNYYSLNDGIYRPSFSVVHNNCEYDESGFKTLVKMQEQHFWYKGRHRFLEHAVKRYVKSVTHGHRFVDMGGSTGDGYTFIR